MVVAAVEQEWSVAAVLAVAALVLAATAGVIRRLTEPSDAGLSTRLAHVAWMWLSFTLACAGVLAAVFVITDTDAGVAALTDPWSLLFEMASATSTTGLTMTEDPSLAASWLQWYRSVLQWTGAIGVVVFAVLVAEPSGDADSLVGHQWSEAPGDNARETVRRVGVVFVALTAAAIGGLLVVGEPAWRAVNHGLTAAATGGFAITSDSAAASGPAAQVVLAAVILLSAMSFGTLWDVAQRRGQPFWRRTQIRFAAVITGGGIVASLLVNDARAIGAVVFDSISASTTAGFSIASSSPGLPALATITLVSMFIGGAAGSTAGGIKVARVAWLVKAAKRWLPGGAQVDDEVSYGWDGEEVGPHDARARIVGASALVVTWMCVLAVGVVILATRNRLDPVGDVVFEAVSA
jgi:trk system potassium uptake protein TrkH